MKTQKSISLSELAKLSGVTARRLEQLVSEKVLPETISRGELPFDEAISKLFEHFRGSRGDIARERLLLLTAKRKLAEEKLHQATGGDLVTLADVERGLEHVRFALNRFISSDLYNGTGLKPSPELERVVHRTASQAVEDAKIFIQQTIQRTAEIAQKQ